MTGAFRAGSYDALIYGAGIAPTLCAALLAKKGRSVLLICPQVNKNELDNFDAGPAVPLVMSGLTDGYPVHSAFRDLGLIDALPWRQCSTLAQVLTPKFRIRLNTTTDSSLSDELRIELSSTDRQDLERLLRVVDQHSPLRNGVRSVMSGDPSSSGPRKKVLDAIKRQMGNFSKEVTESLVMPVAALISHCIPLNMATEEAALLLALQCDGLWRLDHGVGAVVDLLKDTVRACGGTVLNGTGVASLVVERNKVTGLLLNSHEGVVKGRQVVICDDLRRLYEGLPSALKDGNYLHDLSRVEQSHIEHTVIFEVNEDSLPSGMAEDVIYLSDPSLPLEGENYLSLRVVKGDRGKVFIHAMVLVPERVAKTQPKALRRLSAIILRKMEEIMPFVEYNILHVWPDFRQGSLSEALPPLGDFRYYVRGSKLRQGFNAVSIATPHENMHACGPLIWPSLGLYGEALSGLRAAEAVMNERL